MGAHTKFATNALKLPDSTNSYSIDIDGGGRPENQLKSIVSAITVAGFDLQGPVDMAVKDGSAVLLMDEQSADLMSSCSTVTLNLAKKPPAAPQFNGMDNFTIDTSQMPATLVGQITAGQLNTILPKDQTGSQVQTINLSLPLAGGVLPLTIFGAHVQGAITATGIMSGQIHGVIRQSDINSEIIPAVATLLTDQIHKDPTGGTTMTIIKLFEDMTNPVTKMKCMVAADCCATNPATCKILPAEVQGNSLIQNVLAPDVQGFQNGMWSPVPKGQTKDSLSVGLGFTAVADTFQ